MDTATFSELLAGAQQGNELAWAVLYNRYAARVRGYAASQGADDPDAVLGDTFVDVARNVGSFRGTEASFRSWVFMVAHNRIVDGRRSARRRTGRPLDPPRQGNAETEAVNRLVTAEIEDMLDSLTADQRDVLLLRVVAGLTVAETADILDKQPGAVKAAQRRGLERLRSRPEFRVTE